MTKKHPVSPYLYPGLNLLPTDKIGIKQLTKHIRYNISSEEILSIISEECQIDVEGILSRSRKKELVFGRHMFCSVLKRYFGYSLKKIGSIVERDHTTIINSIDVFRDRYIQDLDYRELVHRVYERVGIRTF
jgi:chromosomal replication initiator protein